LRQHHDGALERDDLIVTFRPPADPISMNDGDSWSVRAAVRQWRDRAYYAWIEHHRGVGPSGRAFGSRGEVRTVLPFVALRRRDPINYAKTVKHIVDGFVLAGAWPDDTLEYVEQCIPTLIVAPRDTPVVVRIIAINPLEEP
jgi:hypothetical protein